MLTRVLRLRFAIGACLASSNNPKQRAKALSEDEWAVVADLAALLAPFELCTTLLSGQKYPTVSLTWPSIKRLFAQLEKIGPNLKSDDGKQAVVALRESLKKRLIKINPAACLGTLLDPRFKTMDRFSQDEKDSTLVLFFYQYRESRSVHKKFIDSVLVRRSCKI
jgi:hypothetical protein